MVPAAPTEPDPRLHRKGLSKFFRPRRLIVTALICLVIGLFFAVMSTDSNSTAGVIGGCFILFGLFFGALAVLGWLGRGVRRLRHGPVVSTTEPDLPVERRHRRRLAILLAVILVILIAGAVVAGPIADNLTISRANPAMIQLAQQAGMSRQGELLFLRAKPQLDSDTQLETDCSSNAAANNSDGFIEQGCYVPTTNKIYLRQMPSNLYDLEVSTAAYEMLHVVYINLSNSGQSTALDQAIESNFTAINDSSLNAQVANFAKTEPDARDLELFSLLGTGYSNLSSNLAAYYAPYFTNIGATVAANNQVNQLFQTDQAQLSQLQSTIETENSQATTAYADSASWARAGNQTEDDYNYNIYVQDINTENGEIDQYNQLLAQYNTLVTEFNGTQPVNQLKSIPTESS